MSEIGQRDDFYGEETPTIADYLEIVIRRKWWGLLVLILGVAVSVWVALKSPPIFQSSGTILINQARLDTNVLGGSIEPDISVGETIELLTRTIMTKGNLLQIAEKNNLFPESRENMLEQVLVKSVQNRTHFAMLNTEVSNLESHRSRSQKKVLEVSFEYENDPKVAQAVANSLIDLFLAKNSEEKEVLSTEAREFLVAEEARTRSELEEIEAQLTKFKEDNLGLLPKQMSLVVSERERTERELLGVEQQIRSIRASNIQLAGQLASTDAYIYEDRTKIRNDEGEEVLSATGRLQTLQQQYHALSSKYSPQHPKVKKLVREIESLGGNINQLASNPLTNDNLELAEVELAEARQKYSSSHPVVRELEAKVSQLRSQAVSGGVISERKDFNTFRRINPAFSSLKSGIASGESELQSLYQRRDKLLQKIDSYTKNMSLGPAVEEKLTKLDREYKSVLEQNSEIKDKLIEIEQQKAFQKDWGNDVFVVLDKPELPISPIKPNRKAILAVGILLSLGLAFVLIMVMESMDQSIINQRVLSKVSGKTPLGVIPVISG